MIDFVCIRPYDRWRNALSETSNPDAAMMAQEAVVVPLGRPEWRINDMTNNNTRYDWFVAAPSDDQLGLMWTLWAIIFGCIATYVAVIFFGIAINRAVRKSTSGSPARSSIVPYSSKNVLLTRRLSLTLSGPFNCYLIYLMIPDLTYTTACTVGCALNAINGQYWSEAACRAQSVYIVWGAGANCWLNAVVAYEIRKMMLSSHIRKRYFPPTRKFVSIQAAVVYVYCFVLGLAGISNWDPLPHQTRSEAGLICVPLPDDFASEMVFWFVFTPMFMGIPLMYTTFVIYDIWKNNLLPPKGKRRLIGLYFFRIVMVFGTFYGKWQNGYGNACSRLT